MKWIAATFVLLAACGPELSADVPEVSPALASRPTTGVEPRRFAYTTLDGKLVTSAHYRGRMTLITLVATYDMGSQVQARYVNVVVKRHVPRINALLLVLEPADHKPLVEAFVSSLSLRYDVAFADADTIAGTGPFPGLHHVPSVVLLDREGREVWRNLGLADDKTLSKVIAEYDDRSDLGRR